MSLEQFEYLDDSFIADLYSKKSLVVDSLEEFVVSIEVQELTAFMIVLESISGVGLPIYDPSNPLLNEAYMVFPWYAALSDLIVAMSDLLVIWNNEGCIDDPAKDYGPRLTGKYASINREGFLKILQRQVNSVLPSRYGERLERYSQVKSDEYSQMLQVVFEILDAMSAKDRV